MSLQSEISDLDKALREAGASVDDVLRDAGINRSTWTRWKGGSVTGARYDDVMKVKALAAAAIDKAREEPGNSGQQGAAA